MTLKVYKIPLFNNEFGYGSAFSKKDVNIILNKEYTISNIWTNSPYNIHVYFLDSFDYKGDSIHHNEKVDTFTRNFEIGIHDNFINIQAEQDIIKLVLLSNLSPYHQKLPITGWIIGHKIGHTIQDYYMNRRTINKSMSIIDYSIYKIDNIIYNTLYDTTDTLDNLFHYKLDLNGVKHLTMNSARNNLITNTFEIFPELLTQYLINGKITLIDKCANNINHYFDQLVNKHLLNKVLVEI